MRLIKDWVGACALAARSGADRSYKVAVLTYKVLHGTAPRGTWVHSFLLSICPVDGHYALLAPIVCWCQLSDFRQSVTNHWAFKVAGRRVWNTLREDTTTSQL